MKVFGDLVPGVTYKDRPGAYAVVTDAAGKYAILKTPTGYFLPGGGVGPNETHEEALKREVMEEIGLGCEVLKLIGVAAQLLSSEGNHVKKIGKFFEAKLGKPIAGKQNNDHELVWMSLDEARQKLTQEYQAYMLSLK